MFDVVDRKSEDAMASSVVMPLNIHSKHVSLESLVKPLPLSGQAWPTDIDQNSSAFIIA